MSDSINVLGTRVDAVNYTLVGSTLCDWLAEKNYGRYVCVTGVHGVMESLRDENIRRAHNYADLCVPDGMPLVWIGRARGHKDMSRVYGPDLMLRVLEISEREGLTNFFYGGAPGVAEQLKISMQERLPSLKIIGTHTPPYGELTPAEEKEVLDSINTLMPDILWIGLSTPRQEMLMSRFRSRVKAKVMFGVGAAFDFHTGRVPQAPTCIQNSGLEWLFRLCVEPRRLWKRYLRNNPSFLFHLMLQITGVKKYPIDVSPPKTS